MGFKQEFEVLLYSKTTRKNVNKLKVWVIIVSFASFP